MSRLPLRRALSSVPQGAPAVSGMRVDARVYTDTGGSGLDATTLSSTLEEASAKARSVYRMALRDIPDMRRNFNIVEDERFVKSVVRDLFEKHKNVTDSKVVDMLTFKAIQELREISEQWKSRTHLYSYIHEYAEKVLREERANAVEVEGGNEELLKSWKDRGLVPPQILNWGMYLRWKEEEEMKFNAFAVENKLFSEEQLERNKKADAGCTIM